MVWENLWTHYDTLVDGDQALVAPLNRQDFIRRKHNCKTVRLVFGTSSKPCLVFCTWISDDKWMVANMKYHRQCKCLLHKPDYEQPFASPNSLIRNNQGGTWQDPGTCHVPTCLEFGLAMSTIWFKWNACGSKLIPGFLVAQLSSSNVSTLPHHCHERQLSRRWLGPHTRGIWSLWPWLATISMVEAWQL